MYLGISFVSTNGIAPINESTIQLSAVAIQPSFKCKIVFAGFFREKRVPKKKAIKAVMIYAFITSS